MTLILETVLVKFLADKVKEKATSDLTDAAWKPVTGLVDAGQQKLFEVWGSIDLEFADVLRHATAASYVSAVRETLNSILTTKSIRSSAPKVIYREREKYQGAGASSRR